MTADVQNYPDDREIPIDRVGVKGIRYPVRVLDRDSESPQSTIGRINMYVNLPSHFKGTHMSRFLEILNEFQDEMTAQIFPDMLKKLKKRLEAQQAHAKLDFVYFKMKQAPVSGSSGLMDYDCSFTGNIDENNNEDFILGVTVIAQSVCPCSKELAQGQGAHNQRSRISLSIRYKDFVWLEELIEICENSASAPVYSVLKRSDEKAVTIQGYQNAKFVEDIIRDIAVKLNGDPRITWYYLEVENLESIHNHSAYACLEKDKRKAISP